ncbi:putative leucine-rich repeat-containing protein DDB_G0290503 [Centruroides vittatus]|uniref:putative leucine-rich repeat-containing protein DDB_G0290503 n=1 Tax=Centruroides vittatus TaxID=120091 RepID=UPI00350EAA22
MDDNEILDESLIENFSSITNESDNANEKREARNSEEDTNNNSSLKLFLKETNESDHKRDLNIQLLVQKKKDLFNSVDHSQTADTLVVSEDISDQSIKDDCSNNTQNFTKELSELSIIVETTQSDKNNEESGNDATMLMDANTSTILSEDKNIEWESKDYYISDIFSLLSIWNDVDPKQLKSLNHTAAVMKNLLCEHLPTLSVNEAIPDSLEGLLILLQDCLSQYKNTVDSFKSKVKELEVELEENRRNSVERYNLLIEEHKARLSRIFKDHEQQLTAAIERAVNARKQAGSLQAQLDIAQAKVEQLENQGKEFTDSVVNKFEKKIHELVEEKEKLMIKIEVLEKEIKLKNSELQLMKETNLNLQEKKERKFTEEREYLKKLAKELAAETAFANTLQNELQQEQHYNRELWMETDRKAQEVAVLQSKLETSQNEICYKDRLLKTLKEDILENFNSFYQETLNNSSSLSDSNLLFNWVAFMKQRISDKDTEIDEISNILVIKELALINADKGLKEKESEIENMKEQHKITQQKLDQLSEELNGKKELVNRFAIHLKKVEKKLNLIINQTSEKSNLLQSCKKKALEMEDLLQELEKRLQEGKEKEKNTKTFISISKDNQKQLLNKFKSLKKHEEVLKNQYLSKQSHIDYLEKLLTSKQKLINNLEFQLKYGNDQLTSLIEEPNTVNLTTDVNSSETSNSNSVSSFREHRKQNLTTSINKTIIELHRNNKSQTTETELHKELNNKRNYVKYKTKKRYIPLKASSIDSGHISGSVESSFPSLENSNKSRENYNSADGESLSLRASQTVYRSNYSMGNFEEGSSCHLSKTNSPLTVNVNKQLHERDEAKQLCCNVATGMNRMPPKPDKLVAIKDNDDLFLNTDHFIENRMDQDVLKPFYPRSSTPILTVNHSNNTYNSFYHHQNFEREHLTIEGEERR